MFFRGSKNGYITNIVSFQAVFWLFLSLFPQHFMLSRRDICISSWNQMDYSKQKEMVHNRFWISGLHWYLSMFQNRLRNYLTLEVGRIAVAYYGLYDICSVCILQNLVSPWCGISFVCLILMEFLYEKFTNAHVILENGTFPKDVTWQQLSF